MRKSGWHFPKSAGFTGSAGMHRVRGYMQGGRTCKEELTEHKSLPASKAHPVSKAGGGKVSAPKPPKAASPKMKSPAQMIPGRQTPYRRQDLIRKVGFNKKALIGD